MTTAVESNKLLSRSFFYCNTDTPFSARCSSDCRRVEYCIRGTYHLIECESQGKEFCDPATNQCSDKIDSCKSSNVFCPSDGIWPNLRNCSRYFHCEGNDVKSYECDYGTIYNYKTNNCEEGINCNEYTYQTKCKNKAMVAHENPNWFVFCSWSNPILAECPRKAYSFNENTGNCEFKCEDQNLWNNKKIGDEMDSSVYYSCYKKGNKWITKMEKCRSGTKFDSRLQVCRYI